MLIACRNRGSTGPSVRGTTANGFGKGTTRVGVAMGKIGGGRGVRVGLGATVDGGVATPVGDGVGIGRGESVDSGVRFGGGVRLGVEHAARITATATTIARARSRSLCIVRTSRGVMTGHRCRPPEEQVRPADLREAGWFWLQTPHPHPCPLPR